MSAITWFFIGAFVSGLLYFIIEKKYDKPISNYINKFKPKNSDTIKSFNEFGEKKKLFDRLRKKRT